MAWKIPGFTAPTLRRFAKRLLAQINANPPPDHEPWQLNQLHEVLARTLKFPNWAAVEAEPTIDASVPQELAHLSAFAELDKAAKAAVEQRDQSMRLWRSWQATFAEGVQAVTERLASLPVFNPETDRPPFSRSVMVSTNPKKPAHRRMSWATPGALAESEVLSPLFSSALLSASSEDRAAWGASVLHAWSQNRFYDAPLDPVFLAITHLPAASPEERIKATSIWRKAVHQEMGLCSRFKLVDEVKYTVQ